MKNTSYLLLLFFTFYFHVTKAQILIENSFHYNSDQSFLTIADQIQLFNSNQASSNLSLVKATLDSTVYGNWDTNQFVPKYRRTYKYDTHGRVLEGVYSQKNSNSNDLILIRKTNYEYDSIGYLSKEKVDRWIDTTNSWANDRISHFNYSSNGLVQNIIYLDWNQSNTTWDSARKTEVTYNSDSRVIKEIKSLYDLTTQQWNYFGKTELEYLFGQLSKTLVYSYDSNNWEIIRQSISSFDSIGNQIQYLTISKSSSGTWDTLSLHTFEYLNNGAAKTR